jgi:hypothetical protein
MSTTPNDPRVDELRRRLRSLGYLDAGVDRFVLGPARDARRPAAIAALASLRIGLLAAILLGPAAAVGIGTRLPGLVTGNRDAVVIALYLAVLFGTAVTVVAFVASLLAARLPVTLVRRHARLVARGAGVAVGAACLIYLTLWWRIANADAALLSPLWTVFVLLVAVGISLLLGHATSITAFAVMAAGGGSDTVRTQRTSAWRLTAAAAVIAFAGAAGLLLVAAPAPANEAPAPHLAVVSPGVRLKLIAIDGFDPAAMDALASTGRIPVLARLFANGAIRLGADAVRDPAREWTTIATGQPPAVHGVQGLETRRVAGLQGTVTSEPRGLGRALRDVTDLLRLTRPSTASGTELRAKTIWEVAADAGLRAAVVNWWATWPATSSGVNPPIVVSDRATLRLERGGALDGEIAPPDVYQQLRREWPAIKQQVAAAISEMLPTAADSEAAEALRRAAEVDATQIAIASRLDPRSRDLLAIYLPGLDIAQHALLGSGDAIAPSELAARLDALRGYYFFLDGLLREITAPAQDEIVFVVAEPGRIATITRGAIAVSGAHSASGVQGDARPIDVAPTLLHALGVPISRELPGGPIVNVLSAHVARRFPVREVETYGRRASPDRLREGQPLDREMIERLRSLGYVR